MELVPIHPIYGVQDWDAPAGAISWQRMTDTLEHIQQTGKIPAEHRSHDHLNVQTEIPIDSDIAKRWSRKLEELALSVSERTGQKIIFGILDGFLLYWHQVLSSYYMQDRG